MYSYVAERTNFCKVEFFRHGPPNDRKASGENTKELGLLALSRVKVIERQANFAKLVRFVQDESGEQTGSMDK